jgi:hypothetical protein
LTSFVRDARNHPPRGSHQGRTGMQEAGVSGDPRGKLSGPLSQDPHGSAPSSCSW